MDITAFEDILKASVSKLEDYIRTLFREDASFGYEFKPLDTWDDTWKLVGHFEGSLPAVIGQRFHIYLSLLLDQKVARHFHLSDLDKIKVCRAAILATLDPLDFDADVRAVANEQAESGLPGALNLLIRDERTQLHKRVTDKIVSLKVEDMTWRMENDIPF